MGKSSTVAMVLVVSTCLLVVSFGQRAVLKHRLI